MKPLASEIANNSSNTDTSTNTNTNTNTDRVCMRA